MTSSICYVCDAETDWRCDFSKIKSQHSNTPIQKLLQRFLGDFKSERDLEDESNRICIECITKIDEYDWSYVMMIEREKAIRNILLKTEKLYVNRSANQKDNEPTIHKISVDNGVKINDYDEEKKIDPDHLATINEPELSEGTNESNIALVDLKPGDSNSDCDGKSESDEDYIPLSQISAARPQKKRGRKRKTLQTETNAAKLPKIAESENLGVQKKRKGRKIGQKNHDIHVDGKLKCSECLDEFHNITLLRTHMQWHRRQRAPKFKCPHCAYILNDQKALDEHKELHKTVERLECVFCHKIFTQKGNLGLHMKIHQGLRNHICDICGKDFLHFTSFECHMKYHNNERNIACPHCPMKFVMSSHLYRHLQTHKKDKPYACSICGNRFGYAANLRVHQKMHDGTDKPQACSFCGAAYARKSKLVQHMLKNHGTATPHAVIENALQTSEVEISEKAKIQNVCS